MSARTKRFPGDAEMTAELIYWRFPGVCSRWRKRQPERIGCRQWRVWWTARSNDWWRLNGGSRPSVQPDVISMYVVLSCTTCNFWA